MSRRRAKPARPWYLYILALAAAAIVALAVNEIGTPTSSARTSTETVEAANGVIQTTVTGTGNVEPSTDVTLNFATSGTLQAVDVKVGQNVKKGQLIATLDPASADLTLNEAKSTLAAAQDNLTALKDGQSVTSTGGGSNASQVSEVGRVASNEFVSYTPTTTTPATTGTIPTTTTPATTPTPTTTGTTPTTTTTPTTPTTPTTTTPAATTTTTATTSTTTTRTTKPKATKPKATKPKATKPRTTKPKSTKTTTTTQTTKTTRTTTSTTPSPTGKGNAPSGSGTGTTGGTSKAGTSGAGAGSGVKVVTVTVTAPTAAPSTGSKGSSSKYGSSSGTSTSSGTTNTTPTTKTGTTTTGTTSTKPTPAEIASEQATVDSDEAAVKTAEQDVADTKLYAPSSGTISALESVSPGQSVSTSGTSSSGSGSSSTTSSTGSTGGFAGAIAAATSGSSSSGSSSSSSSGFATLINSKTLTMTVSFSESNISSIHVGQTATVSIDALSGVELAAKVTAISPTGTSSDGVVSYDATITVTQDNPQVRPGMSATATVITGQAQGVTVPNEAITGSGTTGTVDVLTNGKAVPTDVVVGLRGTERSQIVSGVTAGQELQVTITLPALGTSTSSSSSSTSSGTLGGTTGFGGATGGAGGFGGGGGGGRFFRGGGG